MSRHVAIPKRMLRANTPRRLCATEQTVARKRPPQKKKGDEDLNRLMLPWSLPGPQPPLLEILPPDLELGSGVRHRFLEVILLVIKWYFSFFCKSPLGAISC